MFTTLTAHAVIAAATRAEQNKAFYAVKPSAFGIAGTFTVERKGEPDRFYTVTLPGVFVTMPEGTCSCKGHEKNGICPHVYMAIETAEEIAAEEAMIADLYEREEAKDFMLNSSREHNIGFTAEVYADTAASFGS
ncbi:MAG: hypothetical protein NTX57_05835 [Armatimonadetes bacterium]|nr:hypothetical protein [Armatimonadota bacterium]